MRLRMTFAAWGHWRSRHFAAEAGGVASSLPMTIQLLPYGDFRLTPLEGTTDLSGEPTSSPPIVIDAQRTVTDVDRIVETVDLLGRATLSSPDIDELAGGADRISSAIGTDLSTSSAELTDFPNH